MIPIYDSTVLKYYDVAIKKALTPYDKDDSNWYKLSYELKNDFSSRKQIGKNGFMAE